MNEFLRQRLIFFVDPDDANVEVNERVKVMIERLEKKRSWSILPPSYIDSINDPDSMEGEIPRESAGGSLQIYSAAKGDLPAAVDKINLDEVECFINEIKILSSCLQITVEFELDGMFVGSIECGKSDISLEEGLLGPWRRHLAGL